MGTRHLTVLQNEDGAEIAVMYGQWDGYPTGHGNDLKEFLQGIRLVNGIGADKENIANGMDCLAAQIIANFKQGVGSFYLMPGGTRDCGEQYIYTVHEKGGAIHLTVFDVWNAQTLFDGLPKDFQPAD